VGAIVGEVLFPSLARHSVTEWLVVLGVAAAAFLGLSLRWYATNADASDDEASGAADGA
jgi:hypothetical protein